MLNGSKRYCKLVMIHAWKSLHYYCILYFGSQYCIEVKDTANWMLCMHRKVCIDLVQNASSVNLLHFEHLYSIEVK